MKKPLALSLVAASVFTLSVAIAAAPKESDYAGRPLPGAVKELLWLKVCDVPQADVDVTCGRGAPCPLRRSDGTAYKPQVFPWQDLTMFEWPAASNAFTPAFVQGKLATEEELGGSARTALELASGLQLAVAQPAVKPGRDGAWVAPPPLQINPTMVAWVQRELLPKADEPMCGKTAAGFYDAAFREPTRVAAEVYAALNAKGLLKKVSVSELSSNFDSQKGKYAAACTAIAKKAPNPDGEWPRAGNCWWWLRRAATGTVEPVANLLGEVLRRYDADGWKKFGKSFPKVVAPKGELKNPF